MGEACPQMENTNIPSTQRRRRRTKRQQSKQRTSTDNQGRLHVLQDSTDDKRDKETTARTARTTKPPGPWGRQRRHREETTYHWSRFGKFRVGTRKTEGAYHMDNTTKKSRGTALIPRKTNPCELCDQELKTEGDKQAKGKFLNWKMR